MTGFVIHTFRYGPAACQAGELYLPDGRHPPVVCLLHGGFWRLPYGRDQMHPIACDLARRGYAVWNIGYRRVGEPGGGWPGTFDDVSAGLDQLAELAAGGIALDLGRVAVAGHSAGGLLALWWAARQTRKRLQPRVAIGLAPVLDLVQAHDSSPHASAVADLLGGAPHAQPLRYALASPRALLPLGVPQCILHGALDDRLPIATARTYTAAAMAAGDDVRLTELPDAGHMDFLDPDGEVHARLRQTIKFATSSSEGRPDPACCPDSPFP